MKNKGQMFLITAVIVIITLIILVTNSNITNIIQEKRELEGKFEGEFFINIVDELVNVIDISYHQSSNITSNVFDFGNFTRKKMTERLLDFELLFVGSITPISSGNDTMNVSVINLLDKPISATLRFNNSAGLIEINSTYAENSTQDVTSEVNISDDVYAYEECAGQNICTTPYIFYNFTTSETYENITYEGYYTASQPGASAASQECWDGTTWISAGAFPEGGEQIKVANILSCSNTDGNYTFRTGCSVLGFGVENCKIYVDYIYLNKTGAGDSVKSSEMVDSGRWDTNFSITQGQTYTLIVGYNGTYSENVTIATKSNESVYIGFFDITLAGSETTYKDKFQKSYTLP